MGIRLVVEGATGVRDLIRGVMDLTKDDSGSLGAKSDEGSVVSRALHRLKLGGAPAPRIAVVGETSVGKTALVNVLFGSELAESRLTADTTEVVLRAQFPSNLVIYDTPGIFGKEKLENITRLFIGLEQDFDKTARVRHVPFQPNPDSDDKIMQLSGKGIRQEAPIDIVLWIVNVASPLKRATRRESRAFFLELDKKFGKHLVVAGTHLDLLQEVSEEETEEQLEAWNEISNGQIIPLSTRTGEGLTDLTTELFKRLPGNASLSKLQQSLNQIAKIDRLSFVVTEVSYPLAMIMLMGGDDPQEIEINVTILITLLCSHYSVTEEIWKNLHGNSIEIARRAQQTGVERVKVRRAPAGIWEKIKSWFGATFYTMSERYQTLGVQGLSELLPIFYELIHDFEDFKTPLLTREEIRQEVLSQRKVLERMAQNEDTERLAFRINDLLKSLLSL